MAWLPTRPPVPSPRAVIEPGFVLFVLCSLELSQSGRRQTVIWVVHEWASCGWEDLERRNSVEEDAGLWMAGAAEEL